jgi:hypothetical protein
MGVLKQSEPTSQYHLPRLILPWDEESLVEDIIMTVAWGSTEPGIGYHMGMRIIVPREHSLAWLYF